VSVSSGWFLNTPSQGIVLGLNGCSAPSLNYGYSKSLKIG